MGSWRAFLANLTTTLQAYQSAKASGSILDFFRPGPCEKTPCEDIIRDDGLRMAFATVEREQHAFRAFLDWPGKPSTDHSSAHAK